MKFKDTPPRLKMAGIALKRSIKPCFHNGPSSILSRASYVLFTFVFYILNLLFFLHNRPLSHDVSSFEVLLGTSFASMWCRSQHRALLSATHEIVLNV